jgi:methyl-accepting chemotaxis protein
MKMVMSIGELSMGKLVTNSKDEIGQLTHTVNDMVDNLRNIIRHVGLNSDQVAAAAEELTASAVETSRATGQIAATIQEISVSTDKEVQSVEETLRTVTSMHSNVNEISVKAAYASTMAGGAVDKAAIGGEAVQTAVRQMNMIYRKVDELSGNMKALGDRSIEIEQMVADITAIASQTNLLALNAAIEAARAGEHGRGFAVVAHEVRKLAEQSSQSAHKISELISLNHQETTQTLLSMEMTVKEVVAGIDVVSSSGELFEEIHKAVEEVKHHIQEVSTAVRDKATGTEQIVQSVYTVTINRNCSW